MPEYDVSVTIFATCRVTAESFSDASSLVKGILRYSKGTIEQTLGFPVEADTGQVWRVVEGGERE